MAEPESSVLAEEQAALRRVATLAASGAPAREIFTAVANEVASALGVPDVSRLATDQAALRRVATLVAQGAAADEVYAAVAQEAAEALDLKVSILARFDPGRTVTVLASVNSEDSFPVGSRFPVDGGVAALILDTGKAARVDTFEGMPGTIAAVARASGENSSFGVPIVVEGTVWGVLAGDGVGPDPLPWDIEPRLRAFTELVATAISNTESRDALRRLAAEQAALRRVATLVAEGARPSALFAAVVREVAQLLDAHEVTLDRAEPDGASVSVARYARDPSTASPQAEDSAFRSPITVDGGVWGVIAVRWPDGAPTVETEARLNDFAELVATAVSNASAQAELVASRARIVAAGDDARKRVERDLHDGAQQRLVTIGIDLRRLEKVIAAGGADALVRASRIREDVRALVDEVRELSRGLHPAVLAEAGLEPSLRALARRAPFVVDLRLELVGRLPEATEIAAYYLVSEALTNAMKHAQATSVSVSVSAADSALTVTVADDGVGGARVGRGSGLEGLADRVAALGGRLAIDSPPGRGTRLVAIFPVDAPPIEGASSG